MRNALRFYLTLFFSVLGSIAFAQCPTPINDRICRFDTGVFRVTGLSPNTQVRWFYSPPTTQSFSNTRQSLVLQNLEASTTLWASVPGCANRVPVEILVDNTPRNYNVGCRPWSTNRLVSHYPFNGSGIDAQGSNNMTPIGNVAYVADRKGNQASAALLDINSYFTAPNSIAYNTLTTEITIAAWVRIDNFPNRFGNEVYSAIISKSNGSQTDFQFRLYPTDQNLIASSGGWQKGFQRPYNFVTGQWYHIAMTYDSRAFKYYVNGKCIGQVFSNERLTPDNNPVEIGRDRSGPTKKLVGAIDDVYIFGRALTSEEITVLAEQCQNMTATLNSNVICTGDSVKLKISNPEIGTTYYLTDTLRNVLSQKVVATDTTLTLTSYPLNRSVRLFIGTSNGTCDFRLYQPFPITVLGGNQPTMISRRQIGQCRAGDSISLQPDNISLIGIYTWRDLSGQLLRVGPWYRTATPGTYILNYTDGGTCNSFDTVDVVRVNVTTPTITSSIPSPVCGVRPVTLTSSAPTGNIWSTGDTSRSITVNQTGVYEVRQELLGCVSATASFQLGFIDNRPPLVRSVTGGNAICPGDSLLLRISNYRPGVIYNWRVYRGSQILQSMVIDTMWGRAGLSYEVWADFGSGCTYSCNPCPRFNVIEHPLPAVRTPAQLAVCASAPQGQIGFDSLPTTGVTYSYRWATIPGQPAFNGTVQFSAFGTGQQANFRVTLNPVINLPLKLYLIQRATSTTTTCFAEDTTELTIEEAPVNLRITGGTTVCQGLTTTLTAVTDNDQANFRYLWSTGDTTNSIGVTAAGTYSVFVNSRRIQSCPANTSSTVTLLPFTYLPAGPDKTVCATDSIHDIGLSGATQMAVAYDQTYDTPLTPPVDVEYRFTTSRRALVVFKVKPGHRRFPFRFAAIKAQRSLINGCFKNDTVWFTVLDAPTAVRIQSPFAGICAGGSLQLTANATAYADTNFTYRWSTGKTSKAITITQAGTYRVTATLNGCTKTDSITIVQGDLNTVSAGNDASTCAETNISLGDGQPDSPMHSYQWSGINGADVAWLQQTNVRNPVLRANALFSTPADTLAKLVSYVLLARHLQTACEKQDTITITVNPPVRINAGQDNSICSGSAVTLGTPAKMNYAYSWSPALGLSNTTVAQPVLTYQNPTDTAQRLRYVLTVTNNGCVEQDTIFITYQPKPRFEIVGNPSVCPGVQGVGYAAINVKNGQTYEWLPNAAILMNGQGSDSITVNWPNIRSSRITLKAVTRSAFGCVSDTVSFNVRVLPTLEPQIPRGDTLLCQEELVQTYTIPRSPGSVYTWFANNGAIISPQGGSSITVRWAGAREGYLQYRENVTADTICEGYSPVLTIRYSPKPDPQPILGLQPYYCGGQQLNLRTNRSGTNAYIWKVINLAGRTIDSAITTDTTYRPTISVLGRYVVTVNAWSPQGCYGDTTVQSLIIAPIPTANAGANQRICAGGQVSIGASADPALRYRWLSRQNLTDSTVAQPVFTAPIASSRNYNLVVEVTDRVSGCQALDTVTITVDSLPAAPAMRRNQTICQSSIVQLADTASLGLTYNWQPTTWLTDTRSAAPRFNYPLRLTRDSVFKFYSTTTVPGTGCQRLDSVTVLMQARPNVASAIGATLCSDGSSQIGILPQVNVAYQWSPAAFVDLPTAAQPNVRWTGATLLRDSTVNMKLVARNQAGCQDSITVPVLFRALPLKVAGADAETCEGFQITIGTRPVANYTYQWQPMRGFDQLNTSNPRYLANDLIGNQDSVAKAVLLVTDMMTRCQRLDTATITIRARARFDLVTRDTVVCAGPNLVFNVVNRQGTVPHNYTWYVDNLIVGGGNFLSVPVSNLTGSRRRLNVKLEAIRTDINNCMDERTVSVVVLPNDTLSLSHNRRWVCPFRLSGHRYTVRSGWTKQFRWQVTGGAIAAQDSNSVTVNWDANASRFHLQVDAITTDGCVAQSDTVTVKLDALANQPGSGCSIDDYPLIIPNVITPNGDGQNDALVIDEISLYPDNRLTVYDRYGKELVTYQPYRNQYDGSGYPAGTYYIMFDTGRGRVYKGWCVVGR